MAIDFNVSLLFGKILYFYFTILQYGRSDALREYIWMGGLENL